MHKKRAGPPSLDLIRGFEAAARHMSFTLAAAELFVTQSAVSRQIKALEDHLGVALFRRMNRALLLTDAGQLLYRTATDVLKQLEDTASRLMAQRSDNLVTVTTTVSFASLWLVPRLQNFRALHPEIDVRISADNDLLNLQRERIDLAVRFCEARAAPPGAARLASEEVFPVCSPKLARNRSTPLKKPADLVRHVLLHYDDATGRAPWLHWSQWFAAMKLQELKPAGTLHFSHYEQLIQAAIEGEGVALGRTPLVKALIRKRLLMAPFTGKTASSRQYFIVVSPESQQRADVQAFATWLLDEASHDTEAL